jgi:hypothetical protein
VTVSTPAPTRTPTPPRGRIGRQARQFGYLVAVAINAVMLYVANRLLEWEWPSFLTQDFDQVLPIVQASLIAGAVINLAYVGFDAPWFKSVGQIVISAIGVAVAVRMFTVFPFDFSRYDFAWDTVARAVIVVAIIGSALGIVVETLKLFRTGLRTMFE